MSKNQFRPFKSGKEIDLIIQLPWSQTGAGFKTTGYAQAIESILKNIENKIRLFYNVEISGGYELELNTDFFAMSQTGYKSKIISDGGVLKLSIKVYLDKDIDRGLFACDKCRINTSKIKTETFSCIVVDTLGNSYKDYDYRIFSKLKKIN